MRFCPGCLVLVLLAAPLLAGGREGAVLDYRLSVQLAAQPAATETGFRLVTTPALVTRNKEQRPRMGAWRIEPVAVRGVAPTPAQLMRALGLCYFSGPGERTVPLAQVMTIGGRRCRLWQVQTPPGLGAYVYLAEVAPGVLALAYLSATLPGGDPRSVELHLTGLTLGARVAPVEEGTALLRTLQRWAVRPTGGPDPEETETVP
jgi:hypothetical protein